jgi:putative transposase
VLGGGRLRLPKIGDVSVRWSRPLPSVPSSVTVVKDAAGRYFASFVVRVTPVPLPQTDAECGIDLGLTHFAVLDDGTKITSPRFLRRAEKKLKRAQKNLARKQNGSKRREDARVRLARAHAKVTGARRNFQHKLSTALIRENQGIMVEDLAVSGLARTKLAKSVHDRDVNAAKNILALGRRERLNARGGQVRPAARLAPASETGSHRSAA